MSKSEQKRKAIQTFRLRYAYKYPDILNPTVTVEQVCMCVNKGWRPIVAQLINDLKFMGWDGALTQVKEKFGELRFYADNLTEDMWKLVDDAEFKSRRTCEDCGVYDTKLIRRAADKGWIRALCESCREGKVV